MSESEVNEEVPAELEDVLQNQIDVNSQGKLVKARKKKRPEFTDEERALILEWLECRYKELYGRGHSSTVAQDRDKVWGDFLIALNDLHDPPIGRTLDELIKKIDNMKTQARTKNRLWGKHVTGNPSPYAYFNDQDLAILSILGDTVAFTGVKPRQFDTLISMPLNSMRTTDSNAKQCHTEVVASTSNITASINTGGKTLDSGEMLQNLRAQKKARLIMQEQQQKADLAAGIVTVPPTITVEPAEPVVVQVAATSQRNANGEQVITLDLDQSQPVPPTQNVQVPVSARKSATRRAVKRTYASATTNTAPDFAQGAGESVSDEQYYPAYLFQSVPSKLQTDNLRKMALISIIERNKAQSNLIDMLKGCVGPFKNALLAMCGEVPSANAESGYHAYQVRGAGTNGTRE